MFGLFTAAKLFFTIGRGVPVLGFVQRYWKVIAIVVLVLSAVVTFKVMAHKITTLRAENTALTAQLAVCNAKIDEQNAQIERESNRAKTQQHRIDQLGSSLKEQQKVFDSRVQSILNSSKPQTCQQSIDYLVDFAKERNK